MRLASFPAGVLAVMAAAAGAVLAHHILDSYHSPALMAWTFPFLIVLAQWLLSWLDKPRTTTPAEDARLARLKVVVVSPVYNEGLAALDRSLRSLTAQTRPPQRIHVVNDGSTKVDYRELKAKWLRHPLVRWTDLPANAGKKHAQAEAFTADQSADIFVTIDSDTFLPENAIEEVLKPFADRTVQSVAGIELAYNSSANWLTRTRSAAGMSFQMVACGAQSVFGDILVNRGAFSAYRAPLVRRVVGAYLNETFAGWPVRLGDDAALTLFAECSGRAVQQSTAFAFTLYPEKTSHHIRQWVRWMRGSTIRNCWRLRYLPLTSYSWWFTILGYQSLMMSLAVPVIFAATWPHSRGFVGWALLAGSVWGVLASSRILCVQRSDESWLYRIVTLLSCPFAQLWGLVVLHPLRIYGICTFRRQGWNTRNQVEVTMQERAAA